MKQILKYSFFALSLASLWGCKKDVYPGGVLSPYISVFDVRPLYKGTDVILTRENLQDADSIAVLVVSDFSGGNMPAGLLAVQDARRLSKVRGISIDLGTAATKYTTGDSLVVKISGGTLTRPNGILKITGLTESNIRKVSSGNAIPSTLVPNNLILANPDNYESALITILKGGFDPLPAPGETLKGDKNLNDGNGSITLHTEATASFADTVAPVLANFTGIVFTSNDGKTSKATFRLRTAKDIQLLSSEVKVAPVVITGFLADPYNETTKNEANYEYIQLKATKDIDFSKTPFAVVTTNNAGASTPVGNPTTGWATGGLRTFKFNLFSGTVKKGEFFYVGGTGKKINGETSGDISAANWIRTFDYTKIPGDGFGAVTTNILANSGNASGIAVFADSAVNANSEPVDVMFIATGGTIYAAGPPEVGYRITNTDYYDLKHPQTLKSQGFYRAGSNTRALAYPAANIGYFELLGGVYDTNLGRWTTARSQTNVLIPSKGGTIDMIETNGTVVK
ncbi:DUF5689 domain-containing protein [Pinibacter aurantiacus]|uniref:DUF5689 domain-containing protein n=1 Tax=Pinibacter aurantiacus TaxID=2851599 RepID=A0A9E2W977_9BACT|nr:DUF5689 domain-containing protein [Pinibacter aurantiacus]MBV4359282.1 hypothetical protein [Pinibacter aurantiacus]